MNYAEKFKYERPSPQRLAQLGALVDEIEDLNYQKSPFAAVKLIELNSMLSSPTDIPEICSYSGSCSQKEFLATHLVPDAYQHQNLNDDELLWLIAQLQEHFREAGITWYYGTIVDINTSSPSGSTFRAIDPDRDPTQILTELKANRKRVIQL